MVDSANGEIIGSNNVQEETDVEKLESYQHEDDKDNDNFSFVGYIGPSPAERLGNASRTELYRCRSCSAFTRFPRYNKALWVTQTRRGRCGEYSMLLYRMLRALGYKKIRWVVDWADHVWVEALLGDGVGAKSLSDAMEDKGRWVHLDPCEAAVDNPLLYSSWGKNQTYLMAFYDPSVAVTSTSDGLDSIQAVEDVTLRYTKDGIGVVTERRGVPEQAVAEAIKEVSCKTVSMLKSVVARS
jgi:peptide-N4-(N-acetyl-beta-glucosaminyl)asparagine amidase